MDNHNLNKEYVNRYIEKNMLKKIYRNSLQG